MHICYYCETTIIKSNRSVEHVIPNSIGGRLKSYSLLCKDCNADLGRSIDAELGKQFDNLTALLGIDRDRNKDYIIKNVRSSKGNLYHLVDGKNPIPAKPDYTINGNQVSISASDEKQLKQVINGLKRKYPTLNDGELSKKAVNHEYLTQETFYVDLGLGGDEFLKAIGKIAINAYLHFGGQRSCIAGFIDFLRGKLVNDKHVHHYYIPPNTGWRQDEISHNILCRGDSNKGILYAYIVLFSSYAFVVNLSDNYDGQDFECQYGFDINAQKSINNQFGLEYSGRIAHLARISNGETQQINTEIISSIQLQLGRTLTIMNVNQRTKTIMEIWDRVANEVLKGYPLESITKEERLEKILQLASPKIAKLILYWDGQYDKDVYL